jgi:sulfane dehydrogenase subunit SoxC
MAGLAKRNRRTFIGEAAGGVIATLAASKAAAETLADVPPRMMGAPVSGRSERSSFAELSRIPESTAGKRNVAAADAINSKTPLQSLVGTITPSDLHYERSHAGVPDLDPAKHRLLIHGMAARPTVLRVADLRAMPSFSRIMFLECSGNGWENWKAADPSLTVQNMYGMLSTHEWTGVPLRALLDMVGRTADARWMLAEGGDGSGMARSIPLTDEILDESMVAYAQNGESLRPAHGFPLRLLVPGFEGNMSVKWLRRLKLGDQPFMTRWETARYTGLMPDGRARQFHLRQDVNSVITNPSGMMHIEPGYHRVSGIAWSGHGKIEKVEFSADGGLTWRRAQLNAPVLAKAQTRFEVDWEWDGSPAKILSRSTDEKGNIQPDRKTLVGELGTNAVFHYNAQQTWAVDRQGRVTNVLA